VIPRAQFIASVRSLVGTPIVHLGRAPGRALDCVGVPWVACVACGLDLAPTPVYDALPREAQLTAGLALFCDETTVDDDAHLWQVLHGRQARHVVVPVGMNQCGQAVVVHAWAKGRVVREVVSDYHIARLWRIRGVE
jgi:hypothetical protein